MSNEWPEAFRDYVDYVQETRGEAFATVADVRFVDPADLVTEYQNLVSAFNDANEGPQAVALRVDDMYRALGLTNDEFNVLEANQAVLGAVGAFYSWQQGQIVFPSAGGQELQQIPIRDRPLLVHELGHALQASSRLGWSSRLEDPALALALREGEAEWLSDRYLLSLPDDEWQQWFDSFGPRPEVTGQPEILQVGFAASYALGSRFFHARYAIDGLQGVAQVFEADKSAVSAQMLLDPWLFTGNEVRQESFLEPLVADEEGQYVDIGSSFQTSAVNWHQILGAAIPGDVAIVAARGINSYTFPTGWTNEDDRLCFAIEASASPGQEIVVEKALRAWSQIGDVTRWFEITDRGFLVGGCDPGPGHVPQPRAGPLDILDEVAVVLDSETWAVDQGLDRSAGFCAAWDLVAILEVTPETDQYDAYNYWFDELDPQHLPASC